VKLGSRPAGRVRPLLQRTLGVIDVAADAEVADALREPPAPLFGEPLIDNPIGPEAPAIARASRGAGSPSSQIVEGRRPHPRAPLLGLRRARRYTRTSTSSPSRGASSRLLRRALRRRPPCAPADGPPSGGVRASRSAGRCGCAAQRGALRLLDGRADAETRRPAGGAMTRVGSRDRGRPVALAALGGCSDELRRNTDSAGATDRDGTTRGAPREGGPVADGATRHRCGPTARLPSPCRRRADVRRRA